jgi:hypothetical protein
VPDDATCRRLIDPKQFDTRRAQDAVGAGRLDYDEHAAAECAATTADAFCLAPPFSNPSCDAMFVGRVVEGDTCTSAFECGGGAACEQAACDDQCCRGFCGAPVPEPPPGVEADLSDEAEIARAGDTLRERLERHRANPNCAACHQIMDPIGLALENYDLVGRWRTLDGDRPIDATATMIDGTVLHGPEDLRTALLARSDLFVTVLTEKLLTYALGRVVDHHDMPAVRAIVARAAEDDYAFSAIVRGIAASAPFQMRIKTGGAQLSVAAAPEAERL